MDMEIDASTAAEMVPETNRRIRKTFPVPAVINAPMTRNIFASSNMFPKSCDVCRMRISCLWPHYLAYIRRNGNAKRHDELNRMKITRGCCRNVFLSHLNLYPLKNSAHRRRVDVVSTPPSSSSIPPSSVHTSTT